MESIINLSTVRVKKEQKINGASCKTVTVWQQAYNFHMIEADSIVVHYKGGLMAKLRVYELARELNLTNKVLLDRMQKLKISVRSHMSALEDEIVHRIRNSFTSKKKQEKEVDEKRVKPTIIRRRRRKKRKSGDSEMYTDDSHSEQKNKKNNFRQGGNSKNSASEKSTETETDKQQNNSEKSGIKNNEGKFRKKKKRKKGRGGEPARIIKMATPKELEMEEQAEKEKNAKIMADTQLDDQIHKPENEFNDADVDSDIDADVDVDVDVDVNVNEQTNKPEFKKKSKKKDKKEKINDNDKKDTPPLEEKKKKTKDKPDSRKEGQEKKKKKKSKKRRKDEPAKIIKKADPVTIPEPEPEIVIETDIDPDIDFAQEPSRDIPDQPIPTEAQKKKRKKGKKRQANENQDEQKFFNKRISFRKKEVVEGSALYSEKKGRGKSRKSKGGQKKATQKAQKTQITTPKAIKRRIKIYDAIILADIAKRMGVKASDVITKLMEMGVMATVNQSLDYDTAVLIATEFQFEVEKGSFEEETVLEASEDAPEDLKERPPVVTIMGHVDHGKTSLLDAIRETRITETEAGGITQHIGAYNVQTDRGQIVFLDTPGHEAFTTMRARGAQITDIVVLVVAADDGVMPQTIEAINHSKAAEVPIIVAVNKMDKLGAEPDRVKRELSDHGLMPEDWGGDAIFTHVSAKNKEGIDELLEMILLQSEVMELKANPNKHARGHVVEAKIDSGRGSVATVLIQEGTLHKGDPIVCGVHSGKVRALLNDRNQQVNTAGPSIPVEILGLTGVPMAGDELIAVADDKTAKQVSHHRIQKQRMLELAKSNRISLDNFFEKMQTLDIKSLNLIVKADVHGSIEAINDSLTKLSSDEVKIEIVHSATGTITETDISLAAVSEAIVIGFNVRPSSRVQDLANEENVDIRFYDIIYNLINDIKDAVVGMMSSTFEDEVLGHAEVREIFSIPKIGVIAGSYVTNGKIERNQQARLLREGVVLYTGKISSLKRFKEDAKEVLSSYECGIGIENYNDIKVGDVIECFHLKEIKPVIEETS
ncbi:translation initiation factor IF-2 [Candidatus Magnetomorum sp. HK-1]|nr:translation initiation factor IF-2 [Candidatus Magnetomorum sp. HK-1]